MSSALLGGNQNKELKKLMIVSGRLPETHWKTIQSYPFIFFNDVSEAKLEYSVAIKPSEHTVFHYELSTNIESNNCIEKRYKGIEKAIKDLFWKEAQIKISINGQEVYKSE